MSRGVARRLAGVAHHELPSLLVLGCASLISGFGWNWTTRPMGDSASYRAAAVSIFDGWHHLTDRTLGYPLLLWATGSTHGETHLLFVAQLALHAATVLVVVRLAGRIGVPGVGRGVIALLLVLPPEMILVVSSGSEALAQFLVVMAFWSLMGWFDTRRRSFLVAGGVLLGLVGWVTPALALLAVPCAVVVCLVVGRSGPRWVAGAALVAPAAVVVGVLLVINVVRFDTATLTPLTGWYLGSRTSLYVQRLPAGDEPARSILVAERNRELLEGDRVDAPNYSFAVRGRLSRALHMTSRQADTYMLRLNLRLITRHPLDYVTAVGQSVPRYLDLNSQPGVAVAGRASAWAMELIHLVLAGLFGATAAVMAGLAWLGRLRGRLGMAWAVGVALAGYGLLSATMLETGAARLRTPFDPVLVLLLVSGITAALAARRGPEPALVTE